ncbi:MAG: hypothetical protein U0L49_00545 [Eubacterium sp.]|nr:hypothetical protein [Eubacterium sp.]
MKARNSKRQKGSLHKFMMRPAAAGLAVIMLACGTLSAEADDLQSQIDAAKSRQANSQSQLQSVEQTIADLESKKGQSEAYLTELNTQLTALSEEVQSLNDQCDAKQQELDDTEVSLASAYRDKELQYNDMKKRIQYMYENSTDNGMLEAIFSAESFTDFISRVTTMSDLTDYDRKMLDNYEDTCAEIEAQEAELTSQKEELTNLQTQAQQKQADLTALYNQTASEVQSYAQELQGQQSQASSLLASIQSQQNTIAQLSAKQEEQKRQAAAEAAAAAYRNNTEAGAASAPTVTKAAQPADANNSVHAAASTSNTSSVSATSTASASNASSVSNVSSSENSSSSDSQPAQQSAATITVSESTGDVTITENEQPAEEPAQSSSNGTYLGHWVLTGYCPCSICCGAYSAYKGLTASGAYATPGVTVAMYGVPFGTKLSINGHVYTVQDRGTPYGHVDVYFATHAEACAFGRQYADVYQVG